MKYKLVELPKEIQLKLLHDAIQKRGESMMNETRLRYPGRGMKVLLEKIRRPWTK